MKKGTSGLYSRNPHSVVLLNCFIDIPRMFERAWYNPVSTVASNISSSRKGIVLLIRGDLIFHVPHVKYILSGTMMASNL